MHLRRSHIALLFALVLHAAIVIYMAFKRVDFYPTNQWTYMRMKLAPDVVEKPFPLETPETELPTEIYGVDARRQQVAKTNEAVNEALKNLSSGAQAKMEKHLEEQYEREVREMSKTGLFSPGTDDKPDSDKPKSGKSQEQQPQVQSAEKGLEKTGNKTLEASNITYFLTDRTTGILGLRNPVYLCQGGGMVVVDIVVNQNGDVVGARADMKRSESADPCLIAAAEDAARMSVFNVSLQAPEKQRGTITYRFISQ